MQQDGVKSMQSDRDYYYYVHLSPSSIIDTSQWAAMPWSWEGNRRSGVIPPIHHRH